MTGIRKPPPSFGMDDCERPACDDMVSKMKQASAAAATSGFSSTKKSAAEKDDCPPTSGVLGDASWKLLHTMAAWYPDRPSSTDQQHMSRFMQAFAHFYPCTWCAKDFQDNIRDSPPKTASRTELCQWMCDQHNRVNKKLGKPLYSCDMKNLDERWRKSSKAKCNGSGLPH